ncbi:MAG: cofactor-independent phosphoglycerate mutase [Bacteroidaceae bacterium]|nr:cofactor-independent phosphoglycerate mutase [Bacteroidaceae bacterium]
MKHIIILGDGMADHAVERLGGKTPLQYAKTPYMDMLAKQGRTGLLKTVPHGFPPGSEVANTAILGYDLEKVYEGRGPLEAASIGYEMQPGDMAIRCNLIAIEDGKIKNHHANHITTQEGTRLIRLLDEKLGNDKIKFVPGIQYRHLLVIKGGNKNIVCNPPHDHPNEEWRGLLPSDELLSELIIKSQEILPEGLSIWPWSPGYRPSMTPLTVTYPQIKKGSVITAVDLIRGIGHYAGLRCIEVEGATGLADTNYEGKAKAAIDALKGDDDFVFLHVEASDEAGHDGDLELKVKTIEYLDSRIIGPIYEALKDEGITIAVLPDHPTPVEIRTHVDEPIPFLIWNKTIDADDVQTFDEIACKKGGFGTLKNDEFMKAFMAL